MKSLLAVALALLALPASAQNRRAEAAGVDVERDVEYGVANDISLMLDIYKPKTPPQGLMPAVVWIHGGGWRAGDKNNAQNPLALASRGFFAVSINYRLSGVAPFPASVEDCKCAVRWLRANAKKYSVDPERIGVWGSSAGGHLALMVGCADEKAGLEGKGGYAGVSSRVAAVCSWFGPADFTDLDSVANDPVALFMGGTKEEKEDAYAKASPVTHASKDDPPVLMIHGDRDRTVELEQSERMVKALQAVGAEVELVVVKNAGHSFKPEGGAIEPSRESIDEKSLKFFEERLKKSGE